MMGYASDMPSLLVTVLSFIWYNAQIMPAEIL